MELLYAGLLQTSECQSGACFFANYGYWLAIIIPALLALGFGRTWLKNRFKKK